MIKLGLYDLPQIETFDLNDEESLLRRHGVTNKKTFEDKLKQQPQRLITFETFDQNYEET